MSECDDESLASPFAPWTSVRETTLLEVETQLAELDLQSSGHDLLLWMDRLLTLHGIVKAARETLEKLAIHWIQTNGPLVVSDEVRYGVGYAKTVRCVDVRETLHTALEAVGGDLDDLSTLLSANAWKHGACRKLLCASDFDRLFVTEIHSKLITENPPLKLIRLDDRYRRGA